MPLCVQEHKGRKQQQSRIEALSAEVSAARAEVATLKARRKTMAEQALSSEAQVTQSAV